MKKTKILSGLFIIVTLVVIGYGVSIVFSEVNYQTGTFKGDGYALVLDSEHNKTNVLSFNAGTTYDYKKYNNQISFNSNSGNTKVDDTTVIHYQDKSLLVLKNTVGMDLSTVDNNVIFYYNIFKNSYIGYENDHYVINTVSDEKITFDKLLLRITDSKFLLLGSNVRAILSGDEVVNFDDYAYFEYVDGQVIKIYNDTKYYQTISDNTSIISGDIQISLKDESISKANKKYISLSNLVIDRDGNINLIQEEDKNDEDANKKNIEKSNVEEPIAPANNDNSSNNVVDPNEVSRKEEDEDDNEPTFKITKLSLTSLKVDATIEIDDKNSTLNGSINLSIVENATSKVIYESSTDAGDLQAYISYPNLKPDTEYTLYAKAPCLVNGLEYDKTFISKIFRTEALGVDFEKSYATDTSISVIVSKETYSKVSSVMLGIYNSNGETIDYKNVSFNDFRKTELTFSNLDSNTDYVIKLYDILSGGVVIDDGLSISKSYKTLKKAPNVGKLEYAIDKHDQAFKLSASEVSDRDYGITGYRFEVFDSRQGLVGTPAIITYEESTNSSIKVDDIKIHRGVPYTYRLVVEFFDNEKKVEYTYNLGSAMQMDGVDFPTIRWSETYVTWEQINGAIVIDDPSGAIVDNKYKIIYKNSVDVYSAVTLNGDTTTNTIPINVNYLRANETYTFDVYAKVNLQDGNPVIDEAYIGSVKVHTKSPNSLTANYNSKITLKEPFSVSLRLSDSNNNASLEANTLSTMSFTLYQGSTTDGMVEVFRKTTDTNTDEYISTLKSEFYDHSTDIDPAFFGSDNSFFKQKTYTLVIDEVYDYTGVNKIPIENNVYQFQTNKYVPDEPNETETKVVAHPIVNKYASEFGLKMNNELDVNTTIGYQIKVDYDNSSMLAKYIVYHVWRYDYSNDEFVMMSNLDKRVNVDSDGTIPEVIYEVYGGSPDDQIDTSSIKRGNSYYFSAEIYLDIDEDGTPETIYPNSLNSNSLLRSANVNVHKQKAEVNIYPAYSSNNSFTWKYIIKDVDYSLAERKLYGFVNANDEAASEVAILTGTDNYSVANFTGLNAGDVFTIKTFEKSLKSRTPQYNTITSQYFYGYKSSLDLRYSVSNDVNKFVISFDNYSSKLDEIDRIAKLDINIVPKDSSLSGKTIQNLTISDGEITIDYSDIVEYVNTEFSIDLVAYYDSGNTGFEVNSEYVAIQKGSFDKPDNYYAYRNNQIVQTPSVYGTLVKTSFSNRDTNLSITNINEEATNLEISIDNSGVVYRNNNIIFKEIKSETLSSNDKTVSFDFIIPSVSLTTNNKINISPLITGAFVNAKIINKTTNNIRDKDIFIEIFEVNENGTDASYVETVTKKVEDFNSLVELSQLKLHTNYYLKMYAYVYNSASSTYEKMYLYDIDQKMAECVYNFHTLSDVGISNVAGRLESDSYNEKNLVITYDMENTIGFNTIKYSLYHVTEEGYQLVNVSIPESKAFINSMSLTVGANPKDNLGIRYGETYVLRTDVYATYQDGEDVSEILLESKDNSFTLADAQKPFIGISSGKSEDSIYFRVSIIDSSKLIVNGEYETRLYDSDGKVIASSFKNSISYYNKKFEFKTSDYNLVEGETYTFKVFLNADYSNSGSNYSTVYSVRTIRYGSNVYLGTITLSQSTNTTRGLDMIFTNSYELDNIDKISYTINNTETDFVYNATKSFYVRYDAKKDLYYYVMEINDDKFDPNLFYLVSVNFYVGNELVENAELGYGSI